MIHVPHFTFPLIPTSFAPTTSIHFKVEIIISEHGCCLVHVCVCHWRVSVLISRKQDEGTHFKWSMLPVSGCVLQSPWERPLIHLRGAVARFSTQNRPELGRKCLIIAQLITHLQSRGLLNWPNFRWGPFHTSCSYPLYKTIRKENLKNVTSWHKNLRSFWL